MQQTQPAATAVTPGRSLQKAHDRQSNRQSSATKLHPTIGNDFYASVSTVSAGQAREIGSANNSRFLQDLDSSGDAHFKHSSPEQWDADDGFFARVRQPLTYTDLGSSQSSSALPLPSAAGFDQDADEGLLETAIPPCPPTPSRTPGYIRDGPLVRQNSLGESKLLIASQKSSVSASSAVDTSDQSHSLHDTFEGWSTIGQGSFSIAFQAKKKDDGKFYAIKRSKNTLKSKGERTSLLKEFKAAMAIGENDNIVKYHTAWQENGCLWMQMELCDRGSLKRILQKVAEKRQEVMKEPRSAKSLHRIEKWGAFASDVLAGRLPESSCWRFAGSVARGLTHIHSQGYIYLDVKPDNTFITRAGEYKLGDLGMAAVYRSGATGQPAGILRADDNSSDADTSKFARPNGMASRKLSFAQAGGAAQQGTGLFGADDSFEVLRVASDDVNTGGDLSDDEEGDVQYMAAELLKPGNHRPPADMFSLGISLFEVVWGHDALPKSGHEWHALRNGNLPACPGAEQRSPALLELVLALMHPEPDMRPTAAQVAALPQVQHALSTPEDEFLRVFDPVGEVQDHGTSFARSQKGRSGSVYNLLANGGLHDMQAATAAAGAAAAPACSTFAQHTGASMASTTTPFKVTWDDEEKLDAGGAPQRPSARARGYLRTRSGNLMSQTPLPVPCALRGQELGLQAAPSVQRSIKAFGAPLPTPESSHHAKQVAWAPKGPARSSACDNADEDISGVARPLDFALGVGTPAAAARCRDGAPPSTGRGGRLWEGDGGHVAAAARRRLSGIDEESFSDDGSCISGGRRGSFSPMRRGALHHSDEEDDDGEAPSPIVPSSHGSPVDMMGAAATPFTRAGTVSGRAKTKARTSGCLTPQQLDESTDSDRMVQSAAKRMAMMTLSPGEEEQYSAAHGGAAPPRAAVPMHGPTQDDLSSGSGACAVPAAVRGKRSSHHMHMSEPMTATVATTLFQHVGSDDDDARLSPAVVPMRRNGRALQCDVAFMQSGTQVEVQPSGTWSSAGGVSRASSSQSLDSINSNVKAQVAFAVPDQVGASSTIAPGFRVPPLHVSTSGHACAGMLSPSLLTPGGYVTPMAQGTDGEYHWANN